MKKSFHAAPVNRSVPTSHALATTALLGLVSLVGLGGCSNAGSSESQFRAVNGDKASLMFYVGFHLPNDETVKERARGKVLACWYRTDVPLKLLEEKLKKKTIDKEDAYQVFFSPDSKHTRVTRYPSRCEDVPQRAARLLRTANETPNYDAMCSPQYDKSALTKGKDVSTISTGSTVALTGSGFDFGQLGATLLGSFGVPALQSALGKGSGASNPVNQGISSALPGVANLVMQQFAPGATKPDAGTILGQMGGLFLNGISQSAKPGSFLASVGPIASALGPLFSGQRVNVGQAVSTAASALGGPLSIGNVQFTPEGLGNIANLIAGQPLSGVTTSNPAATQPAASTAAAPAAADPAANTAAAPAASGAAAPAAAAPAANTAPAPAAANAGASIDEAHPEVTMAQLDGIQSAVSKNVGVAANLIFAGEVLRVPECPEKFQ